MAEQHESLEASPFQQQNAQQLPEREPNFFLTAENAI